MKNITVSIPTNTWRKARVWCAQEDMSLSQATAGYFEFVHKLSSRTAENVRKYSARAYSEEAASRNAPSADRTAAADSESASPANIAPALTTPEHQPVAQSVAPEKSAENACVSVKTPSTPTESEACSHPAQAPNFCEPVNL